MVKLLDCFPSPFRRTAPAVRWVRGEVKIKKGSRVAALEVSIDTIFQFIG